MLTPQIESFRDAMPNCPDGLSDRSEDVLEPLFAIADAAGEEWPDAVREAAVTLMGTAARTARATDHDLGLQLLADLQRILAEDSLDPNLVGTTAMLTGLRALEDGPWPTLGKNEQPITAHRMARLLRRFDIFPADKARLGGGKPVACYRRDAFSEAFRRYLDFDSEHRNNANKTGPEASRTASEHDGACSDSKSAVDPDKHWACSDVPIGKPDHEDKGEWEEVP